MSNYSDENIKKILYGYLLTGSTLIVLFFIWIYKISYLYLDNFFKNVGIFFILLSISFYYLDIKDKKLFLYNRLEIWGRITFSIVYLHFVIVALGMYIFPLIISDYNSIGLLLFQYLFFTAISVIGLDLFIRLWQKYKFLFGLEWMMSKFVEKSYFIKKNTLS